MSGIAAGTLGYLGFALASAGWMMFAWLGTWYLASIVMPTTNALMSHRVAADAQGELQGAVAALFSLTSIVGPPLMTQLFGFFSQDAAPVRLPGAAFLAAAALAIASSLVFRSGARSAEAIPRPGS